MIDAAVAADPGEEAELPFHYLRPADLLAQRRLADDQVDVRLPLAEDRVLTGQRRLDGPVPRVIIRQTRIGLGQCSCVVRGLQQCGYPLGLIGQNSRGGRLEEEVVLPGLGQDIGVRPVPPRAPRGSAMAARIACCSPSMPYSVSSSRSSLPRMPRWPVSILLIFERSHSRIRAASSSV